MRRSLLLAALLTAALVAISGCGGDQDGPLRIELRSRAPERGNWSPRTISVEQGKPVTIVIRNVDVVTHSFYLPTFDLDTGPIKPGDVREVTFTPDVAGEYLFTCGIWCSDYHMYERGTLVVEGR